jgi:TPR repeat protein
MSKKFFLRAAALGHVDGMFNVAVDAHAANDWDTAYRWYKRAAMLVFESLT